jgi:hypothetical protein
MTGWAIAAGHGNPAEPILFVIVIQGDQHTENVGENTVPCATAVTQPPLRREAADGAARYRPRYRCRSRAISSAV